MEDEEIPEKVQKKQNNMTMEKIKKITPGALLSGKVKIIIIDDHSVYADGLENGIRQDTRLNVVGRATNALEGIEMVRKLAPHIILIDINLSSSSINGIEATRILMQEDNKKRIIVFSVYNDRRRIIKAIQAGAAGYITKDQPIDEFIKGIWEVFHNERCIKPNSLNKALWDIIANVEMADTLFKLKEVEIEILKRLALGQKTEKIAMDLNYAEGTIRKVMIPDIRKKLNAENTNRAIVIALHEGFLRLDEL